MKQHKPWLDEECFCFSDQRKQDKMQLVQDTKQSSVDNLKNVRREASRQFRNKEKEYLKVGIDETHSSFSILSDDRSKASSKTIPPHSAI
jgi:hypothetical protein